ncbi:hypothetical protein B0T26DRAFT_724965 [Lasiosphaeria miniovina]|uniref:Uncharacterized protein n=1 Tax=Lasiosphaeria miniovina TaxID=1954250 RepID=A0AA40DM63_9PEZI|nr:uncharacterized protein B0T26DRAFT_724965 [Lasiosphaeria miniovina]KAK0705922.1 hypothetical protein B0T26DRAFT_724965 [Lasiosphaeria miniovina]
MAVLKSILKRSGIPKSPKVLDSRRRALRTTVKFDIPMPPKGTKRSRAPTLDDHAVTALPRKGRAKKPPAKAVDALKQTKAKPAPKKRTARGAKKPTDAATMPLTMPRQLTKTSQLFAQKEKRKSSSSSATEPELRTTSCTPAPAPSLASKGGEVFLYGLLGRGVKELLVVDTDTPSARLLLDKQVHPFHVGVSLRPLPNMFSKDGRPRDSFLPCP